MAVYRKLGRTSTQRKAMLRNLTTNLLYHGKIVTTDTRAKETRRIAEKLITIAKKEKDNFTEETVKIKVPRKDAKGRNIREEKDGKKVMVYDEVEKTIRKDSPSRLNARRKILSVVYPVTEVPKEKAGRKKNTKEINMANKLFDEIAPRYEGRQGGYTRIIKIAPRKGDGAPQVVLELV